tara:strand:- start:94 stop:516 length:423 start_codon:yes stop_codon:yes gene_type:complete
MLNGRHVACQLYQTSLQTYLGDWRINGKDYFIDSKDLEQYLIEDNLQTIKHEDIAWISMNVTEGIDETCTCCNGSRYEKCDIKYPGILSLHAPNPYSKKYRMIDGRHRMMKMRKLGITESQFYVISFEELKKVCKHWSKL